MLNEILGAKCTKLKLVPWIGAEVRWWIGAMDVCPTLHTSTQADDDDEKTSWGLQYSGKTTPQSIEKDLSEFGGKLISHGEMCWASIECIWPGGRGNWSIKEGTDAESGRGQNFGLQNWAENVEDLLQEVDASRSLTRAWHLRHLCVISYTCAPRGTNISSSLIASKLRKTNLHVAASCLAIKEAGHYDARVVAGQRLQRK